MVSKFTPPLQMVSYESESELVESAGDGAEVAGFRPTAPEGCSALQRGSLAWIGGIEIASIGVDVSGIGVSIDLCCRRSRRVAAKSGDAVIPASEPEVIVKLLGCRPVDGTAAPVRKPPTRGTTI